MSDAGRTEGGWAMFGVQDDALIEGLETIRKRLCCYAGPTCDCKFGASGKGEETGCPEIRQAITLLRGEFEKVLIFEKRQEQNAINTLAKLRRALVEHDASAAAVGAQGEAQ
jgi:hypothetical protein